MKCTAVMHTKPNTTARDFSSYGPRYAARRLQDRLSMKNEFLMHIISRNKSLGVIFGMVLVSWFGCWKDCILRMAFTHTGSQQIPWTYWKIYLGCGFNCNLSVRGSQASRTAHNIVRLSIVGLTRAITWYIDEKGIIWILNPQSAQAD